MIFNILTLGVSISGLVSESVCTYVCTYVSIIEYAKIGYSVLCRVCIYVPRQEVCYIVLDPS